MNISNNFDRMLGALHGLPDVLHTKTATVRTVIPLIGGALTFSIQTYRKKDADDKYTYTTFLEVASAEGLTRIILPDPVIDVIVRQISSIQTKGRRKKGKELAEARKAAGIQPGFLKNRKGRK